jgi:ArsR family metal-binding transcriptional regulator
MVGRDRDEIAAALGANMLITLYATGSVTMTMVSSKKEAMVILEEVVGMVREAIINGVTPEPREKVRVDSLEANKYLPGTNCREC